MCYIFISSRKYSKMDMILLDSGTAKFARSNSGTIKINVDGYFSPSSTTEPGKDCTFILEVCILSNYFFGIAIIFE